MADGQENKPLVDAAKTVGSAVGKVVSTVAGKATGPDAAGHSAAAKENLWGATYEGSGTFIIHKPKRKSRKRHQTIVRNRRRGMRK